MQKFPVIKTSVKGFSLQPLEKKHASFYVELLNDPSVQKTLFRSPRVVKEEAFLNSLEAMHGEKIKEITYILTLTDDRQKIYFGYVKIKLIDWTSKSAYLSVAIKNDPRFRGKGYSTVCYNAFFKYLFSIGFLKIYGRTYEENIATIKLNFTTGFRFIGRQKNFVIYNENQSQDALYFEKLHPALLTSYNNKYSQILLPLYRRLHSYLKENDTLATLEIPLNIKGQIQKWTDKKGKYIPRFKYKTERIKSFLDDMDILKKEVDLFQKKNKTLLPLDWQKYIERIQDHLSARKTLAESIGTNKYLQANKEHYFAGIPTEFGRMAQQDSLSYNGDVSHGSMYVLPMDIILKTAKMISREFFGGHFKVTPSESSSPGGISFTKGTLSISKNHHWTKRSFASFMVHESVHAIVHLNAYQSGLYLLSLGFTPGYLSFQEGLAVYLTQFVTGIQKAQPRSFLYWRMKKYFADLPIYEVFEALKDDRIYKHHTADEQKELLARFWRAQQDSTALPTFKRLAYLPSSLYVADFLKSRKVNDYLWAPIAAEDYLTMSSQFLGRDLPLDLETLIKIKNRTAELLSDTKEE